MLHRTEVLIVSVALIAFFHSSCAIDKTVPRQLLDEAVSCSSSFCPSITPYLEKENQHSRELFQRLQAKTLELFEEFKNREPDKAELPAFITDRCTYKLRKDKGATFPSLFRACGEEQKIVFDPDSVIPGSRGEVSLLKLSPDEHKLAFLFRPIGTSEPFQLWVKIFNSEDQRSLGIQNIHGLEWLSDSNTLIYTVDDNSQRPSVLYRISVAPAGKPERLYEEKRPDFEMHLRREGKDGGVLGDLVSGNTCETLYIDAHSVKKFNIGISDNIPRCSRLFPSSQGFILLEDDASPVSRLVEISPSGGLLRTIILPWNAAIIEDISIQKDNALLIIRRDGIPHLALLNLVGGIIQDIPIEEPLSDIQKAPICGLYSGAPIIWMSSLRFPRRLMKLDIHSLKLSSIWEEELPVFDPSAYSLQRSSFQSRDGVNIPLTIFYANKTPPSSTSTMLLHTYGAYGTSTPLSFSPQIPSLLDRGVVYAIAHIRGGGEFGRKWHLAGSQDGRKNSINDVVDATHYFARSGMAAQSKIFSLSRSAGALAVLNAVYKEPSLFKGMILENPYVDPLAAMNDRSRPGTVREYSEWGNPAIVEQRAEMLAYSPLEQVPHYSLPPMLVISGMRDDITPYKDILHWSARIRANSQGSTPLFIHVSPTADHEGEENFYDTLLMKAREYAFLLEILEE